MKKGPLISIVIPVYNAELYVRDTISSVLKQTYKNIELILVNDGSNDKSLDIICELSEMDKRVKVISQNNCGVTIARSNGVSSCSGDWICFSDADDLMPENAIELLVKKINPGIDIIIGNVDFQGSFKWPYLALDTEYDSYALLKAIVIGTVHCGPVAKLFNKKLFNKSTFETPSDILLGEDKIMFMKLTLNSDKIIQIKENVYTYIQRSSFHPSDFKNRKKRLAIECKILSEKSNLLLSYRIIEFIRDELKNFIKLILNRK